VEGVGCGSLGSMGLTVAVETGAMIEVSVASGMFVGVGNTGVTGTAPVIVTQEIVKIRMAELIKRYRFM
jgi:hypothetical protein